MPFCILAYGPLQFAWVHGLFATKLAELSLHIPSLLYGIGCADLSRLYSLFRMTSPIMPNGAQSGIHMKNLKSVGEERTREVAKL